MPRLHIPPYANLSVHSSITCTPTTSLPQVRCRRTPTTLKLRAPGAEQVRSGANAQPSGGARPLGAAVAQQRHVPRPPGQPGGARSACAPHLAALLPLLLARGLLVVVPHIGCFIIHAAAVELCCCGSAVCSAAALARMSCLRVESLGPLAQSSSGITQLMAAVLPCWPPCGWHGLRLSARHLHRLMQHPICMPSCTPRVT